jgi:hypothetical protein
MISFWRDTPGQAGIESEKKFEMGYRITNAVQGKEVKYNRSQMVN